LIQAFLTLSDTENTQVIITTHSAALVKELKFEHLRLIKSDTVSKTIENVQPNELPYPSLNEVNFLAFSEISEEYHNELYGHIEFEGRINDFKNGKAQDKDYKKIRNGTEISEGLILTEYIRHQIHHPENMLNTRFTSEQLKESIELMRTFIGTLTT
jgi:hypothetical protein